ncbi:hypothetical protein HDV02_001631 [Globomyces sp. JEL0801]|nr:hypothetical protein HDV02_001631 [Globomyces sp. JEL0801]
MISPNEKIQSSAQPAPQPVGLPVYSSRPQFGCLSLNESDKIRLIHFPDNVKGIVQNAITNSWLYGIQRSGEYRQSWEFKLRGNPWYGQGNEAVPARRLMATILRDLKSNGWQLVTSIDISNAQRDKDTLIFRLGIPDTDSRIFSMSINESDKLRLIDAPAELDSHVHAVIQRVWKNGIQDKKIKEAGCIQYKLRGTPWYGQGGESVSARILVMELLAELESHGWYMYASVDMSIGREGGYEKDSWFFEFDSRLIK